MFHKTLKGHVLISLSAKSEYARMPQPKRNRAEACANLSSGSPPSFPGNCKGLWLFFPGWLCALGERRVPACLETHPSTAATGGGKHLEPWNALGWKGPSKVIWPHRRCGEQGRRLFGCCAEMLMWCQGSTSRHRTSAHFHKHLGARREGTIQVYGCDTERGGRVSARMQCSGPRLWKRLWKEESTSTRPHSPS